MPSGSNFAKGKVAGKRGQRPLTLYKRVESGKTFHSPLSDSEKSNSALSYFILLYAPSAVTIPNISRYGEEVSAVGGYGKVISLVPLVVPVVGR